MAKQTSYGTVPNLLESRDPVAWQRIKGLWESITDEPPHERFAIVQREYDLAMSNWRKSQSLPENIEETPSPWPTGVVYNETVNGIGLYDRNLDGPIPLRSIAELLEWLKDQRETTTALQVASIAGGASRSRIDDRNLERLTAVLRHGYAWLSHFSAKTVVRPTEPANADEAARLVDELVEDIESIDRVSKGESRQGDAHRVQPPNPPSAGSDKADDAVARAMKVLNRKKVLIQIFEALADSGRSLTYDDIRNRTGMHTKDNRTLTQDLNRLKRALSKSGVSLEIEYESPRGIKHGHAKIERITDDHKQSQVSDAL
ncbi:MAG: hypothetical protein KDA52_01405 [Planctomycetaceae bacterium]|nr:hypothetical protein [Planctomycetaceae bacterium]